ncbi:hypothetical protein [Bradyrhizobium elkanii]|uniref:hypothetical protein n=1 Tax=Bradyrhizobium elkanii TaxID=29448 RepID=UPI00048208AE|nr:hypothetical protein [Bradyrhizobium elkanii]MCP1927437.1 hypothetical protein [Bradyrhizobium elkanii]WLC08466.1 hypothetical protein QIH86_02775 [Bradyrhizobium elkanii USDA 94]
MKSDPDLYELFGAETEFSTWEPRIKQGVLPTREQLKAILLANAGQQFPDWLLGVVIMGIENRLKGTRGRRKENALLKTRWALAVAKYEYLLLWLQRREKRCGLQGWSVLRGKHWWTGSPHERAARIVIAQLNLSIDWRAFLNRISSHKSADLL